MVLLLGGPVHYVGIALRRAQVVMAQQALDGRDGHVEVDTRVTSAHGLGRRAGIAARR